MPAPDSDPAPDYLARGFLTFGGDIRPGLLGVDATAAAIHLRGAALAPQELAFTLEALHLVLPQRTEPDPADRLQRALADALALVARAIQQRNNPGLARWLGDCAGRVARETELSAFLAHAEAVRRHYGVIEALRNDRPAPD